MIDKSLISNNINQENSLYDLESEQALLGNILIDNKYIDQIGKNISENIFYFHLHKKVFNSIIKLINNNSRADQKTVAYDLENTVKNLEERTKLKQDIEYLISIAASLHSFVGINSLVKILADLTLKRKMHNIAMNINQYTKELDINDAVAKIEEEIFDLRLKKSEDSNSFIHYSSSLKDKLQNARDNNYEISGIKTNFNELDKHLNGFQNSDLIIIAARPSMGKTAFAINLAKNIAKKYIKEKNNGIAFFSLEMSGEQIAARLIASESNFQIKTIHTGKKDNNEKLSNSEWHELIEIINKMNNLNFIINDTAAISTTELRTECRRLKREKNISAIFIDYLQLMRSTRYKDNRVQEISDITQTLKAIAKELNIPVIALSQLSRAVEATGRADKKPRLSDLRESGTIEQDADIVMFLYREAYYIEREEKHPPANHDSDEDKKKQQEFENWKKKYDQCKNTFEIIIAKNRNGPIGTIELFYDPSRMKFDNLATNINIISNFTFEKKNKNILNQENAEIPELPEDTIEAFKKLNGI